MRLIQISVTSVWLLRAVEMDFARGKIRNRWLMMGILLGVVLWIPGMKEAGFPELLGGLLLPVLICWIPFRMRGLGAGDIKLLCVVGCLNGSRDIIYCICISFLLAAGFSFGRLLIESSFGQVCEAVFNIFDELQHLEKLFLMTEEKCPDIKFIFLHLSFWDMQQFWG